MNTIADLPMLRKEIRQKRRQLPVRLQQQAGSRVAQQLVRCVQFKHSNKIGLYLSAFGEVPTQWIMQYCFKYHKQVYLPKIRNIDQKLVWVKVTRQQWLNKRFAPHRLGMQEPRQRGIGINQLDLVIMPLLMFNLQGTRVGMGGGYYDRTLWKKNLPFRLGLAYEFQRVDDIQRQPWDQSLHAVLTPHDFYQFKSTNAAISPFFVNKCCLKSEPFASKEQTR